MLVLLFNFVREGYNSIRTFEEILLYICLSLFLVFFSFLQKNTFSKLALKLCKDISLPSHSIIAFVSMVEIGNLSLNVTISLCKKSTMCTEKIQFRIFFGIKLFFFQSENDLYYIVILRTLFAEGRREGRGKR